VEFQVGRWRDPLKADWWGCKSGFYRLVVETVHFCLLPAFSQTWLPGLALRPGFQAWLLLSEPLCWRQRHHESNGEKEKSEKRMILMKKRGMRKKK
jgi:hypothetical protein